MTSDDIKRLRALCEAATPGPWFPELFDGAQAEVASWDLCPFLESDLSFIAAAREAVPALLDEVERLQASRTEQRFCCPECGGRDVAVTMCELERERDEAQLLAVLLLNEKRGYAPVSDEVEDKVDEWRKV